MIHLDLRVVSLIIGFWSRDFFEVTLPVPVIRITFAFIMLLLQKFKKSLKTTYIFLFWSLELTKLNYKHAVRQNNKISQQTVYKLIQIYKQKNTTSDQIKL